MGCCLSSTSALESPSKKEVNSATIQMRVTSSFLVKQGSYRNDYDIVRILSPHEHKRLLEVKHKRTQEHFVVKEVDRAKGKGEKGKMLKEVEVLSKLGHPNLVHLQEVYQDKKKYYIVMEQLTGGELFDFIVESGMLSEQVAARIIQQLLGAVSYCHKQGVVLRNIKPENIILTSRATKVEEIQVKIVDFGLSTSVSAGQSLHKIVGSELYTAPEVFLGEYGTPCDIWSLGAVLYVMLSGTLPFTADTPEELRQTICAGNYSMRSEQWDRVSEDAKDLIRNMMQTAPSIRYTANDALNHYWMQNSSKPSAEVDAKSKAILAGLRQYQGEKKLKLALSSFVTSKFCSKQEQEEMGKMFEVLDKDHSGMLGRQELIEGLSATIDPEDAAAEADSILRNMDADMSKGVDYKEFIAAVALQKQKISREMMESAFKSLDTDSNGKLSVKELMALMGQGVEGGKESLQQLISQADVNGDGQLSLKEFTELLLQQ